VAAKVLSIFDQSDLNTDNHRNLSPGDQEDLRGDESRSARETKDDTDIREGSESPRGPPSEGIQGRGLHRTETRGSGSVTDSRFTTIQSLAASVCAPSNGSTRNPSLRRCLGPEDGASLEALNEKALAVVRRVQDKLTGRDFPHPGAFIDQGACGVRDQVPEGGLEGILFIMKVV